MPETTEPAPLTEAEKLEQLAIEIASRSGESLFHVKNLLADATPEVIANAAALVKTSPMAAFAAIQRAFNLAEQKGTEAIEVPAGVPAGVPDGVPVATDKPKRKAKSV